MCACPHENFQKLWDNPDIGGSLIEPNSKKVIAPNLWQEFVNMKVSLKMGGGIYHFIENNCKRVLYYSRAHRDKDFRNRTAKLFKLYQNDSSR